MAGRRASFYSSQYSLNNTPVRRQKVHVVDHFNTFDDHFDNFDDDPDNFELSQINDYDGGQSRVMSTPRSTPSSDSVFSQLRQGQNSSDGNFSTRLPGKCRPREETSDDGKILEMLQQQ